MELESCNDNKTDNNKKTLEQLLNIRYDLNKNQRKLQQQLDIIEKEIKSNEADILKTCKHNWIHDPNYSPAPYERPDNVCTICHSIDYRW